MSEKIVSDNVVRVDFRNRPAKPVKNDNKFELFSDWIKHGIVSVLFDARRGDVKVPLEFSTQGDLRLNFSYDFHVPDFNFNQEGIWATLSFDSGEHFCRVSWASIYGLESAQMNRGAVWFESFPEDYDQEEVLGFSESICKVEATTKDHNVVKFTTHEE